MKIVITGSSSGLGKALANALCKNEDHQVYCWDLDLGLDVRDPHATRQSSSYVKGTDADVLINCAGVNGLAWLPDLTSSGWDEIMDVNAKGIFMMTQAFLPQLKRNKGTVINIVSNAAHMPMRCSAAYNASKGAALILTKQMARELSNDGICVFSVSPNKLAGTNMSKQIDDEVCLTRGWTREQAESYQKSGLLTGEETPPELVADFINYLLSSKDRHKFLSGCDIPYGA